jgi:hypothetical protein
MLLAVLPACAPKEEAADETATTTTTTTTPEGTTVATPDGMAATGAGAAAAAPETGAAAAGQAAAAGGAVLASQETNWAGIVVEVTEFRRKGNTLTAKFRVRNQGSAAVEPDFYFSQIYVMDPAAGKKYEALKDEEGNYIAALRSGWRDRWYDTLEPGESALLWVKFPAPPPEVRVVTFQVPNTPPFDELAIQDS